MKYFDNLQIFLWTYNVSFANTPYLTATIPLSHKEEFFITCLFATDDSICLSFHHQFIFIISNEAYRPQCSFAQYLAIPSPAIISSRLFPRIVMLPLSTTFFPSRTRSPSTSLALRRTMKIPIQTPPPVLSPRPAPRVRHPLPPRAYLLSSNQYCEASCTGQVRRWSRF